MWVLLKTSFIFFEADKAVMFKFEELAKNLTLFVSVSLACEPVEINLIDVVKSLPVMKKWLAPALGPPETIGSELTLIEPLEGVWE